MNKKNYLSLLGILTCAAHANFTLNGKTFKECDQKTTKKLFVFLVEMMSVWFQLLIIIISLGCAGRQAEFRRDPGVASSLHTQHIEQHRPIEHAVMADLKVNTYI